VRALRRPLLVAARVFFIVILIAPLGTKVPAADMPLKAWTAGSLPLFALDELCGERADIAQFRGRLVLVHFFATWCEPCRAELQSLRQLADKMHGRPFAVVVIDTGEPDLRVRRFFAGRPVPFQVLLDRDGALGKAWQIDELPTTFVLDADLVPRLVADGDVDWSRGDVEDALTNLIASTAAARAAFPFAP
jgi:thiol-disulfide isomerase/thioredoxin